MANIRVQDGLKRLVEHFIGKAEEDEEGKEDVERMLEICRRLLERLGL